MGEISPPRSFLKVGAYECYTSLSKVKAAVKDLSSLGVEVVLSWIPGHQNITYNEKVDSMAQTLKVLLIAEFCSLQLDGFNLVSFILFLFYFSHPVKKAWDEQKSVTQNLKDMGLSADPNKSLRIATTRVLVESLYY